MRKKGKVSSRSDNTIALRVKQLMETNQWDQKDLAGHLELSEGYVSRILSGERHWPISLLFRTAKMFGVSVSSIDPELETVLKKDLENLELRRDLPQIKVLHAFVRHLPQITDSADLEALIRVISAFAERRPA